jgi:hypothetical protein
MVKLFLIDFTAWLVSVVIVLFLVFPCLYFLFYLSHIERVQRIHLVGDCLHEFCFLDLRHLFLCRRFTLSNKLQDFPDIQMLLACPLFHISIVVFEIVVGLDFLFNFVV